MSYTTVKSENNKVLLPYGLRICGSCNKIKILTEYHQDNSNGNRSSVCKECKAKYNKERALSFKP